MRARFDFVRAAAALICTLAIVTGCGPAPKKGPEKGDAKGGADKAAAEKKEAAPADKTKNEKTAGNVAAAVDSQENARVMLGSPELTGGIPGEGDLTLEQIKKFFDDPKNTKPFLIALPVGLSAGLPQAEEIIEVSPMSRGLIELGRQLYFDTRLSIDNTVSCASCHHPDQGFAAQTQFGVGVRGQTGGRNSPVSYNRILSKFQFWDGRAATLEDQAKGPIANPIEMGSTHEETVTRIKKSEGYKYEFDKLFGGKDGESINIDNVAKAIATFERAIVTGPTPFDYNEQLQAFAGADLEDLKENEPEAYAEYEKIKAATEKHPMSESAKRGRELFFNKASCTACHVGANLTDEQYHNIGVGMDAEKPDLGRYEQTKEEKDKGAFKTPTIRNVALTAPYMHDGSQKTLEEVVEWYNKGGHPNPHLDPKIKKLDLTDQEKADLVEFMKACTGDFPVVNRDRLPK